MNKIVTLKGLEKNLIFFFHKIPLAMRLSIVFLFLSIGIVYAENSYAQNTVISISMYDGSIEDVLEAVEQQTDFTFLYDAKVVNAHKKVSVNVDQKNIFDLLNQIFNGTDVIYTVVNKKIVLNKAKEILDLQQEGKKLTGIVQDENGEPVIGANVVVKGTTNGTITGLDGDFSLSVPEKATVQITYIGYTPKEISVGNQTRINVRLVNDTKALDEVVVVGYGTVKKQNLTSSISKINSDAIKDRPVPTLGEAFQGQLAGVRAQSTSGVPGQDLQIRIRGVNTINGDSSPLYVIDGVPRDDMNDINPSDVASIQVLKDASATSIYGSRGANGVIVIETKQGLGKPSVSFEGYYGLQDPEKNIKMMEKQEYLAYNIWRRNVGYLRSGGSMNDPMSSRPENQRIPESWLSSTTNTDWQDAITRSAPIQNYQVSASAKNDMGSIFLSGGYMDQKGIINNTYYKRLNFRLNATLNISKKLRVGINVAPSVSDQDDRESQGKETVIHHALSMSPLIGLDEATRDWGFPTGLGQAYPNPVEQLKYTVDNTKKSRVASSVWGEYDIIDGLKFKTQFSYNYAGQTYEYFQPGNVTYNNGNVTKGNSDTGVWSDWSIQNTLTYDKTFKDHSVNVLLGQSADEHTIFRQYSTASGWPSESITTLNVATTPTRASTERMGYSTASFFARASYSFKDKYLFTASVRNDGSSRFGSNRKWGIFPSFSGGWKLNEESFLKDVNWISLLKVRAAWGMAGNDRIGNYDYMALLGTYNTSWGNAVASGSAPKNIENSNLQWESTKTMDIGFDFSGFNNRLQLNFDYYINKTDNLLFNVPIPTTTGYDSFRTNLGSIENRGWEIDITSHNITGKFNWSTSLNLSANQNKVLDMGDITEFTSTSWDAMFITRVGGPVSQFYCYRTDGTLADSDFEADGKTARVPIFKGQEIGNVKYVDQPGKDGKKDGQINSQDLVPYGNNLPDLLYGMTNRFSWNNFDFSFLLQGQIGGDVLFLGQRQLDNAGSDINIFSRWINCYKPDYEAIYGSGESPIPTDLGVDMSWDGKTPNPYGKMSDNNSDFRIYDATFLRIKNVTLAYSLPKKVLAKTVLKGLKFYVSIDNLKTFDNYPGVTPETNSFGNTTTQAGVDYSTYPLSKKYTLGVNVTF